MLRGQLQQADQHFGLPSRGKMVAAIHDEGEVRPRWAIEGIASLKIITDGTLQDVIQSPRHIPTRPKAQCQGMLISDALTHKVQTPFKSGQDTQSGLSDRFGQLAVSVVPDTRSLSARLYPGIPLGLDPPKFTEDATIGRFHVEQIPVQEEAPDLGLPLQQTLCIVRDHTDMEGDTSIVEMFHNLSIFKQAALFRSKNIMQRGARQWRLISRSGQADAGTHLQPLLTGPNQGTMFTAAKAAATGKEIEGLKNGGFAGPIGTDQPIEMGMDINVYAV